MEHNPARLQKRLPLAQNHHPHLFPLHKPRLRQISTHQKQAMCRQQPAQEEKRQWELSSPRRSEFDSQMMTLGVLDLGPQGSPA